MNRVSGQLERVADDLGRALEELREIARGIHPTILAEGGLAPALRTLARRSPVPVDLAIRTGGRLPERVEVTAYYVACEALTNAAKPQLARNAGPDRDDFDRAASGMVELVD